MDYKAPYKGNFVNSIMFLDDELRKKDKEIIYIFPKATADMKWIKEIKDNGSQIYFLSDKFLKDIRLIRKVMKKELINIVHIHFANYKYIAMFKLARGFKKNMKFITHVHNHYKSKKNVIFEKIMRAVKSTDLYIGVSNSVADDMIQKGFDKRNVVAVPNAIEFKRLDKYTIINKKDMDISSKKTLLMFGFDYYRKGVDMVIKAIKDIHEEYDITLMISLSTNRNNVESRIIEEVGEIPSWVKIVDARDDIATYYNFADVFISASREEGFCYAAVEAAYCKSLLIASDIPGQNSLKIPYTIQYSSNDIDDLKKSIIESLSIPEKKVSEIKEKQRQFVMEEYNLKKWSSKIINLYEERIMF